MSDVAIKETQEEDEIVIQENATGAVGTPSTPTAMATEIAETIFAAIGTPTDSVKEKLEADYRANRFPFLIKETGIKASNAQPLDITLNFDESGFVITPSPTIINHFRIDPRHNISHKVTCLNLTANNKNPGLYSDNQLNVESITVINKETQQVDSKRTDAVKSGIKLAMFRIGGARPFSGNTADISKCFATEEAE